MRYILSGPPLLGPLLALWWAGGLAQQNYTPSNRLHLFQYTLLSVFMEVGPTGQDISSPAHVTNHSYPYRLAQRTGPPYYNTIHPIQSILLVSIYIILGFHGKRSNMTRNILSSPPFEPLFAFGGLEGWPIHNMPHPIDVSCSNMRCPRCSWR